MHRCGVCGFEAKSGGGLASHERARHGEVEAVPSGGPNLVALRETLGALAAEGRLTSLDAARVQAVQSIARVLDVEPGNAQMWKQYREALADLTEADDGGDSDVVSTVAALRSVTPVVDAETA